MPTYRVVYNSVTKVALVQPEATAVPGGSVNAGTFNHPGADQLGSLENHVLFHHVRDLLYHLGVQNMQDTRISVTGMPTATIAIHVTPNPVTVAVNATQQLTVAFAPTNATDKSVIYESSDPTVATVSATGLVTGKKKGKATIAVASNDGNKMDTTVVNVT